LEEPSLTLSLTGLVVFPLMCPSYPVGSSSLPARPLTSHSVPHNPAVRGILLLFSIVHQIIHDYSPTDTCRYVTLLCGTDGQSPRSLSSAILGLIFYLSCSPCPPAPRPHFFLRPGLPQLLSDVIAQPEYSRGKLRPPALLPSSPRQTSSREEIRPFLIRIPSSPSPPLAVWSRPLPGPFPSTVSLVSGVIAIFIDRSGSHASSGCCPL